MHVRCPSCHTVFRVPAGALEQAGGRVRCGRCHVVFKGRLELVPIIADPEEAPGLETPAPAPPATLDTPPFPGPTAATVDSAPAPHGPHARSPGSLPPPPWEEETAVEAETDAPAQRGSAATGQATPPPPWDQPEPPPPAPEEVFDLAASLAPAGRRRSHPARTLLYAFANVLLAGLLGLQLMLGLREPLLASPAWRPWLERGCALVGCRVPALRDPERIEVIARDIRTHPRYPGGLLVDVTIVNRARFAQPFPVMQLTFASLDEQWFAQRRFQPAEYLGPNRGTAERLPPDIPVQVVLELLDPGPEAVSFAFEFL